MVATAVVLMLVAGNAIVKCHFTGQAALAQQLERAVDGGEADPRILFLDEPSAGLDPITSAGLDVLIKQLSHYFGITFVIVTHELNSINAIADRLVMLDAQSGTIIAEGSPAELREHSSKPSVRQFLSRQAIPGQMISGVKVYECQEQ
jgi:phospholipid/cholesterol/gamma-HCH transport system ATP-binding protein